jgi:regulator of sigma E protease
MILTVVSFIFVLGVVVFVHELGHFIAARLVGARVEIFSIGFGKIFGITRGDTEYRLGYIPLGGFCKIAGMVDESMDEDGGITGAPDEFQSKSALAKIFILVAGVLMNMILGILIYSFITMAEGEQKLDPTATIGNLVQGYPAVEVGILPNDRILKVNETEIESWEVFSDIVHSLPATEIYISWLHEADTLSATLTTIEREITVGDSLKTVGMIGVSPSVTFEKVGFFKSFAVGTRSTYNVLMLSVQSIKMLSNGSATVKDLSGPAGIMYLSGETARAGWVYYLGFIALISVSIGFLNIMPFPVLDGGHIVFVIIEAIIRKPVSTKVKMIAQQIGIACLLILVVVVTYHDIVRFF